MQQPQAVRDAVIIKWCQEDLKLLLGEVPILQQHDLLSTQWTKATRENAFHLDIGRTVVAGQSAPRGPQLEQQPQEAPQQEGQEMMSQAVHRWSHENMSTQEVEQLII